MRFLDADLRPVTAADAVSPLVTAVAISGMTALLAALIGHDAVLGLHLFPPVFIGALLAQAGVTPQRSPWAALACLPVIGLLMAASARLADALPL